MTIDFSAILARERYQWMINFIVPRPIAFVSTISPRGISNLAPFSFFSGVCSEPPVISIAIATGRGGRVKDTLVNLRESGECVVNVVDASFAAQMVLSSGEYEYEVSEFGVAGFTEEKSELVGPPRVLESPVSMECRLLQAVEIGAPVTTIVLLEILMMRVLDDRLFDPLARLGGDDYSRLAEPFQLRRPASSDRPRS